MYQVPRNRSCATKTCTKAIDLCRYHIEQLIIREQIFQVWLFVTSRTLRRMKALLATLCFLYIVMKEELWRAGVGEHRLWAADPCQHSESLCVYMFLLLYSICYICIMHYKMEWHTCPSRVTYLSVWGRLTSDYKIWHREVAWMSKTIHSNHS